MGTPTNFQFDANDPLAKRAGESARANAALRDYYLMGPGRSLRALLARYRAQVASGEGSEKPPSTRQSTLFGWSSKFEWQARITAQEGIDNDEAIMRMDERRRAIQEEDWAQGSALRDLAARILATTPDFITRKEKRIKGSPKVVDTTGQVLDPGEPERIIITLALDARLAIQAIQAGSSLTRLAAGMETDRTAQNVAVNVSGGLTVKSEVDIGNMDAETARGYLLDASNFLAYLAGNRGGGEGQSGAEPGAGSGAPNAERS